MSNGFASPREGTEDQAKADAAPIRTKNERDARALKASGDSVRSPTPICVWTMDHQKRPGRTHCAARIPRRDLANRFYVGLS
jgi:hypothetical protein